MSQTFHGGRLLDSTVPETALSDALQVKVNRQGVRDWESGEQPLGIVRYNGQLYDSFTFRANGTVPPGPTTTATYKLLGYDDSSLTSRVATLEAIPLVNENTTDFYHPSVAAQVVYGTGPLTLKQALDNLADYILANPGGNNGPSGYQPTYGSTYPPAA